MEKHLALYQEEPDCQRVHFPQSPLICPLCQSDSIETSHIATKLGGTVGTIAGAGISLTSSINGARTGASLGALGGPVGALAGGVAGAILGALAGGAAGGATGVALGQIVDRTVLGSYRCTDCGHTFSI